VIEFSSRAQFCPGGYPNRESAGTNMVAALLLARPADGFCQIVLISDGQPDEPQQTLKVAATFGSPIHTICIGPERDTDGGRAFLRELADMTGGKSLQGDAPGLLTTKVEQLFLLV